PRGAGGIRPKEQDGGAAAVHPLEELAGVLADLPEGQREVLLMRYVDELTLVEIAEALGIPLGTVKSRLHAAIAALRADARTREYFGEL
ncbi:MAG: sigma-70 family RNA polymerase sigma factor, partial [Planctomycetota bacterium]